MSKTYIPTNVRKDLWVLSGGRGQFRGCNARIDKNFLTDQKVVVGEYCHIVGDSAHGPRGEQGRSSQLASSASNLILCCAKCHKTIDDKALASEYPEQILVDMKREHELHVQRLYDATNVERSIPLIVTGRIRGTPTAIPVDIARAAVLRKTEYTRFPSYSEEVLDLNSIPFIENDPTYWVTVKRSIDDAIDGILRRITERKIQHIDIFALAPIPALIYIGSKIGDRVQVTVHQPQREPFDKWHWPPEKADPPPAVTYFLPEHEGPLDELSVQFSISGSVECDQIKRVLPDAKIANFQVPSPSHSVVDSPEVQRSFVSAWRSFQGEIHERYGKLSKLHIFPALPASLSVELGRCVLPKVIPEMKVWDYMDGCFHNSLSCFMAN